ncbi:MAG: phage major capsid protein [Betaproteobacteria bacterium]
MKMHLKVMNAAVALALGTVAIAIAMPKAFGIGLMAYAECLTRDRAGCVNDGGPVDFAALKEATEKALATLGSELKEAAAKALAEGTKGVTMSESTKTKVDEMLVKQSALLAKHGEIEAELQAVQQKLLKRGPAGAMREKTPGELTIESAEYLAYVKAGNYRQAFNLPIHAAVVNITSDAASAGDAVFPQQLPGVLGVPNRRMTVRDLITPGSTDSSSVIYVKETGFQNLAAPVSETMAKPKSDITFEQVSSVVKKIATYVKASTEILADAKMLKSYIDFRLRYMLTYAAEEAQLLKGSGVGNNLHGIYTQASAYVAPIVITAPTRIDVLRLAILQSELAEFPATGIVLHPADWAAIELTKDSTGNYIFANPQSLAQPTLWGRPVVGTPAMTVDTFLVGAFKLAAQIFDRLQSNISVATENEDDFIKNLVVILIEERLALAVYRPEGFVKGDLTP